MTRFFFCHLLLRRLPGAGADRRLQARLTFVDLPFEVAAHEQAARGRERFLRAIADIDPDVIVVGEAPLSGAMLETALYGVESGIPVVILDNAYNPDAVDAFLREVGTIADGCVLTGPSSHHQSRSPPHVCQVPPLVDADPGAARALVEGLGLRPDRLVTVLGSPRRRRWPPRAGRSSWSGAVEGLGPAARAIGTQPERVLFGLLALSRLAIVKHGFMQVTECLSLHTPSSPCTTRAPPGWTSCPRSAGGSRTPRRTPGVDEVTVAAATRFLTEPSPMHEVHDGRWDAAARACDFLEALPHTPRTVPQAADVTAPARTSARRTFCRLVRGKSAPGQTDQLWTRSWSWRTWFASLHQLAVAFRLL